MNSNSETALGTRPIGRLMLSMGIPAMVAQLINLLYNIVDRIYIGHIQGAGADALTGIGLAAPVIMLVASFASFAGAGGAPLAAMSMGKKDKARAEKILGNAFFLIIVFSVALTLIFYIIKEPFLYLFGASDATFVYANRYLSIYLAGTVFVQISLGLNLFITAQGKAAIAMLSVIIGAVINIGLDPVFIYGLHMGVQGAALATVISQAVSALWILKFLTSPKTSLRLKIQAIRPEGHIIGTIASLGVSPFIMQSTESLIAVVMNSGFKHYGGDLYVGAYTVMQSVSQLICIPVQGFAQGVQPIMSYNYGAGNMKRVKSTFKRLLVIMTGGAALITITVMLMPGVYGAMFTNDSQLIALIEQIMPVFFVGFLIFGVQMTCQQTYMALGKAKISLFIALLRKVILLTPIAIILPRILNSVQGVYLAEPVSDIISATTCGIIFFCNYKKMFKER